MSEDVLDSIRGQLQVRKSFSCFVTVTCLSSGRMILSGLLEVIRRFFRSLCSYYFRIRFLYMEADVLLNKNLFSFRLSLSSSSFDFI